VTKVQGESKCLLLEEVKKYPGYYIKVMQKRLYYFLCAGIVFLFLLLITYYLWTPGQDFTDGRHDRKRNGIWIQHGWLGDDKWFVRNHKEDKIHYFRNPEKIKEVASLLRQHNIIDVFPHLAPTSTTGRISPVDPEQAELFLNIFDGFRVIPWVGGVMGVQVFIENPEWRRNFADTIRELLVAHPKFSGIHINIEPCPSGNKDFIALLEEVRRVLPKGKVLSVATFPPPTLWHPFDDVHWDEEYYKEVSGRVDQIVVMMYDTALRFQKVYQNLVVHWTREVLDWSNGPEVLLGLPAYQDEDVAYHDPEVENLMNALLGIHSGLNQYKNLPKSYQGIAIYCEWEMDSDKWQILKDHFLTSVTHD